MINITNATGFINSPESIKALETIVSWNADKLLAPPILGGAPGTWEGLRGDKGVAANYMMITDGPWFFSILGDAVKDTMIPALHPNRARWQKPFDYWWSGFGHL